MKIEELLALNSEGLIPGPGEVEENFIERVRLTKENFTNQENPTPSHHWQWAHEQLNALYDFTPRYCSAFYSSKGLAPWQAAATWIDVKRIYSIQIRPSKWISWLVDRDELLAHEAVHATRAAFDEPKAEEIFAYLTSLSKWRQVIGPIFRKPIEALMLMLFIVFGAILQMAEVVWDRSFASSACFSIAAIIVLILAAQLFWVRMQLTIASRNLIPLLRDPKKVRAVLFRLTDREIRDLAKGKMARDQSELRWQLLRNAYFKELNALLAAIPL